MKILDSRLEFIQRQHENNLFIHTPGIKNYCNAYAKIYYNYAFHVFHARGDNKSNVTNWSTLYILYFIMLKWLKIITTSRNSATL